MWKAVGKKNLLVRDLLVIHICFVGFFIIWFQDKIREKFMNWPQNFQKEPVRKGYTNPSIPPRTSSHGVTIMFIKTFSCLDSSVWVTVPARVCSSEGFPWAHVFLQGTLTTLWDPIWAAGRYLLPRGLPQTGEQPTSPQAAGESLLSRLEHLLLLIISDLGVCRAVPFLIHFPYSSLFVQCYSHS